MKTKTLENQHIYKLGNFDKAGRWYPKGEIEQYFHKIKKPTGTWPLSWFRAAKTQKFVKWLKENRPRLLQEITSPDAAEGC